MLFIVLFVIIFIIFLFCFYFFNKISSLLLFLIIFTLLGVVYTLKYRDINDIAWFFIDGKNYRYEIDKNFKFKTNNLIEVELSRNITYKLEFELFPYQKSEFDVKKFESMLKNMEDLKVYILKEKNNSQVYENFNLYKNLKSSWGAGTIIYQDNSRNPFIIGFSSENFPIPFSLKKQKIYLKFDINNEELLNYLNKHQINLLIVQKTF